MKKYIIYHYNESTEVHVRAADSYGSVVYNCIYLFYTSTQTFFGNAVALK